MVIRSNNIPKLVEQLYVAAADPDEWHSTIETLRKELDFAFVTLLKSNANTRKFHYYYDPSHDPGFFEPLNNYYKHLSPSFTYFIQNPTATIAHDSLYEYGDTGVNAEFFNWANKFDRTHILASKLSGDSSSVEAITFRRPTRSGVATREEIETLAMLTPHIGRALTISQTVENRSKSVSLSAYLLELANVGAAILSEGGIVRQYNQIFEHYLESGVFRVDNMGNLFARNSKINKIVETAIQFFRTNEEESLVHSFDACKVEYDSGALVFIRIFKVPRTERKFYDSGDFIAITVSSSDRVSEKSIHMMMEAYNLSEAEGKVLSHISRGHDAKYASSALDLSENTIRWHIQNILRKTDSKNQLHLISKLIHCHI